MLGFRAWSPRQRVSSRERELFVRKKDARSSYEESVPRVIHLCRCRGNFKSIVDASCRLCHRCRCVDGGVFLRVGNRGGDRECRKSRSLSRTIMQPLSHARARQSARHGVMRHNGKARPRFPVYNRVYYAEPLGKTSDAFTTRHIHRRARESA